MWGGATFDTSMPISSRKIPGSALADLRCLQVPNLLLQMLLLRANAARVG